MDREERNELELAEARRKVCAVFALLGVPYEIAEHAPIYSAFDRERQNVVVDALICKNLFLRNKEKNRYYLFTLPIDKRADLVGLQKKLEETRLSFGDADALWEKLHIRPGSVSLLNIVGAYEAAASPPLRFLVDAETLTVPRIGVHPNDNAATIMFAAEHLPRFFEYYGADFSFIEL